MLFFGVIDFDCYDQATTTIAASKFGYNQ